MKKQLLLLFTMLSITVLSYSASAKQSKSSGAPPKTDELELRLLEGAADASPRHATESAPPRLDDYELKRLLMEKEESIRLHDQSILRLRIRRLCINPLQQEATELRNLKEKFNRELHLDLIRYGSRDAVRGHMKKLKSEVDSLSLPKT
ncbi:hypothetical protein HN446_01610 [bacterium]|jgi:hypothetical protein|nr:hypothetical protein [bacterium]